MTLPFWMFFYEPAPTPPIPFFFVDRDALASGDSFADQLVLVLCGRRQRWTAPKLRERSVPVQGWYSPWGVPRFIWGFQKTGPQMVVPIGERITNHQKESKYPIFRQTHFCLTEFLDFDMSNGSIFALATT